jgi:hypothetical protein
MNYCILTRVHITLILGALFGVLALPPTFAIAADASASPAPSKPTIVQPTAPAAPQVKLSDLSPAYQAKIAQIDTQHQEAVKKLKPVVEARGATLAKVLKDPQASEQAIHDAVYQYMAAQAELYLADIHAQRAKQAVYQAAAKTQTLKAPKAPTPGCGSGCGSGGGGGCGCGSGSGCGGGCG